MEEKKVLKIKSWLYDCTEDEVQANIKQTEDVEILYSYMYHYNWDNGFGIPQSILDNEKCDLSTALLAFYQADGTVYLFDKAEKENLPLWSAFIRKLYDFILEGKYEKGHIGFKIPLSRVQLYKLEKKLTEPEKIFIKNIEGVNLDVSL